MLAVLLITILFVAISIYFFFRAEKLQRDLLLLKREITSTQQENKILSKSIALTANSHEEFAKSRLNLILNSAEQTADKANIELLKPLINNYAVIFRMCSTNKDKMHAITKKCFNNQDKEAFKEFATKVIKADVKLQRLWASNNLAGFMSLVEAVLVKFSENKT